MAHGLLNEAAKRFSYSSDAYCYLAYSELRINKDAELAIVYFTKSLNLNSDNNEATKGLLISRNIAPK